MEKLVLALMTWASAQTGLPVPEQHPEIRMIDRCQMQRIYHDDPKIDCSGENFQVQALYDHRSATMLLPDTWSADKVYDISMLLHELVHHMQAEAGVTAETVKCVGAVEKPAYDAQMAWLKAAGLDPMEVMGINGLAYAFLTACHDPWQVSAR